MSTRAADGNVAATVHKRHLQGTMSTRAADGNVAATVERVCIGQKRFERNTQH